MGYKKINRPTALRMFIEGNEICICPCKLRPEFGATVSVDSDRTFQQYENEVNFYMCNAETGRRLAYYIRHI